MSGFLTIAHWDRKPVSEGLLHAAVSAMAHRGRGRAGKTCALGWLGFGQLGATENASTSLTPDRDGFVIVADARLDDPEDLARALGLPSEADRLSDGALILEAYKTWGPDCPEHLAGDFAFAIWDPVENRVFAARDRFGLKPFYYHYAKKQGFAAASELKGLWAFPETPREVREDRIADYLVPMFDDPASTYTEGVFRLPAAHRLHVTEQACRVERYWDLDRRREIRLESDEAYFDGYREALTRAVARRLKGAGTAGFTLSGGLDSSSIVCVAKELGYEPNGAVPDTYTSLFPGDEACDERIYADAVLEKYALNPHFIDAQSFSPLRDVARMMHHIEEPIHGPNLFLQWAAYEAAAADGHTAMLDGYDGDTTVLQDPNYLAELMYRGHWRTLWQQAGLLSARSELGRLGVVRRYGVRPTVLAAKARIRSRMPAGAMRVWRTVRGTGDSAPWTAHADTAHSLIARDFAGAQGIDDKWARGHSMRVKELVGPRAKHCAHITWPLMASFMEIINKSSSAFGLEARLPFCDQALVEFCVGLPAHQRRYGGWNRGIVRYALKDILPEAVRWRRGKADFVFNFSRALWVHERERVESLLMEDSRRIAGYVDLELARERYRSWAAAPELATGDARALWNVITLDIWLQAREAMKQTGRAPSPIALEEASIR